MIKSNIENLYKKITSIVIAALLVSTLATSGSYFTIPASSAFDQSNSASNMESNSTSLQIQNNTQQLDNNFTLPVISDLDQPNSTKTESNSTSLSIHNNTLKLANNQYVVFLPKHDNTTPASKFSSSKLAAPAGRMSLNAGKLSLNAGTLDIGAMPRNDGYCFPYVFLGEIGCGNLQYNDGPVMHNAKILLIFWLGGSYSGDCSTSYYFESPANNPTATNPNDCSYMNLQVQFLKDMCSDPFMKIAAQYTDTTGRAGPCTVYANAGNPWIDTNPFPHNPVLDADLQAEAAKMLARMNLPANLNTQVYIFTPYGVDSCFDAPGGLCFSNAFCAYHSGFGAINYANMPDVSSFGSGCGSSPSPNNDPIADLELDPLSHELMESLTDPNGGGWMFNMMIDHEIADQCAYDDLVTINADNSDVHLGINGNPYYIQPEWSNSNGGCALTEQSLPLPPSDPPQVITATAISPSSITVSWATSLGATSYHVFRSTSPIGPFTTLVGTTSTTSLTDTGRSQGAEYYYELTASNTGGTSAISNSQASAHTPLPVTRSSTVTPTSSMSTASVNPPTSNVVPSSSPVTPTSSVSTVSANPPTAKITSSSSIATPTSSVSTVSTNPPTAKVTHPSSNVVPISSIAIISSSPVTSSLSTVPPVSHPLTGIVQGYNSVTAIVLPTSISLTGITTPASSTVPPVSHPLTGIVQGYNSTTATVPPTSGSLTGTVTVIVPEH